jgi:hypothetical protein
MGLIKVLLVGGVNYPIENAPHHIPGIPVFGAVVRLANGDLKPAYSRHETGPYSFIVPVAVQSSDIKE